MIVKKQNLIIRTFIPRIDKLFFGPPSNFFYIQGPSRCHGNNYMQLDAHREEGVRGEGGE
jgi:hypothetical protein